MLIRTNHDKLLNEAVYGYTHKSGLRAFVLPKKDYSKSFAIFATRYGSVDNAFSAPGDEKPTYVPDGIAHFLEHKLFEKKDGNVFDDYARTGASANAFTSFNMTAYLFSCTDMFFQNLDILMKFVQNPYFTDENVAKEQGIIGQEIRMYQDDPNWRLYFNFLTAAYFEHPVKKDIAGTLQSIAQINKDVLYKCYNTFYNLSNMVLFVAGDIDYNKVFESVDKNIDKDNLSGEIKRIYPTEPTATPQKLIEQNLSVSQPLFLFGFKDCGTGYGGDELLKKEIMLSTLLEMIVGKSSALYQSLYSEGLINDNFETDLSCERDYGFSVFSGESQSPKIVQERILQEINNINSNGLNKEVFERIKKVIYGRYLRQFNSVEKIAQSYISYIFRDIDLLDYKKVYSGITFDHVADFMKKHFNEANMAMSIVNPYNHAENV